MKRRILTVLVITMLLVNGGCYLPIIVGIGGTMIVGKIYTDAGTKESKSEERLKDDLEQVERENKFDEICYQTNNYGDGTGTMNEGD